VGGVAQGEDPEFKPQYLKKKKKKESNYDFFSTSSASLFLRDLVFQTHLQLKLMQASHPHCL
jgi:hypothetical protein